jgi:thiamine biosynthesis lipoprotein
VIAGTLTIRTRGAPDSGHTRDFRYLMGTSVEVEAYGGNDAVRRAAIDEAFGAIAEVDRLMSNYRDDSEVSRINRLASHEALRLSDPMLSILQAAQQVSARSQGAFDATVGPLVRLWGFRDKKPHLPTAAELAAVRPLVDYHRLLIDGQAHTVRFATPGMEIDLGGIAKGFAVEIAANALRRNALDGLIDAGGNQYLVGNPPGKRMWTTGIKDPDRPDRLLGVVESPETSVSTSADYATFVQIGGRRFGHILDPHTLRPSDAALSVTILSRDGTMADAMSKAAFILGPSAGLTLVDSFPGMSGVIAYRRPDGTIGLAISPRLGAAFHPAAR